MYITPHPNRDMNLNSEDFAREVVIYISMHKHDAQSALDLGMGNGVLVQKLRRNGIKSYGVDLRAISSDGLVIADTRLLPFPSDMFDIVTDVGMTYDMIMLQKLPYSEYEKPTQEAYRVLKKGGIFIVSLDFNRSHFTKFASPFHVIDSNDRPGLLNVYRK
jgi:ubiquinone/menaquinone biosynthesis C-methylase UbiE